MSKASKLERKTKELKNKAIDEANKIVGNIKSIFDRDDVKEQLNSIKIKFSNLEDKIAKYFKDEVKPEINDAYSSIKTSIQNLFKVDNKDTFSSECTRISKSIDDLDSTFDSESNVSSSLHGENSIMHDLTPTEL